jgi:hypothetical protein
MANKSDKDALLLVEGNNDRHVILALCEKHKVLESFDILTPTMRGSKADSKEQVLKVLSRILTVEDKRAVGIVLDADDDPLKSWRQVVRVIERLDMGYVISAGPEPGGVVIPSPDGYIPKIGIWLMPDNQTRGALEDFVVDLIPGDDDLRPYATNALDTIEVAKVHRYDDKRSKAFVHTWLAWQKNPGSPIGLAITTKALTADSPTVSLFVGWLNRLFLMNHE